MGLKFNIAIIGAGKIASSLIPQLIKKYTVDILVSRKINSAQVLAKKNSIQNYSDDLKDIPSTTNLFLLTVPDDQISIVAEKLSKLKINHKGKLFIHLSGSENISTLKSLNKKGGSTGSLHIMQTFPSKNPVKIKNCYAAVEADSVSTNKKIFSLARSLGLKPFEINSELKTVYHLSGVFASNFLAGNFFSTEKMFNHKKVNFRTTELLKPVAEKTLNHIMKDGAVKTLSGPVERGDLKTIQHHLIELRSKRFIDPNKRTAVLILHSYVVQSLILLQTAEEKFGKLSANHKKIQKLLKSELSRITTMY